MEKRNLFRILPRDVLLLIASKMSNKALGAWRGADRLLDNTLSPTLHQRIANRMTNEHVFAGQNHTMVLTRDQQLLVCGNNEYGQLGLGLGKPKKLDVYTTVPTMGHRVHQLVMSDHTIVLTHDGQLLACGRNRVGQLGLGDRDNRFTFTALPPFELPVQQVAVGFSHTLVLTQDGQIFTCGHNSYGQLGLGDKDHLTVLTRVHNDFKPLCQIAAGGYHSFALSLDATLIATGNNAYGQLGLGDRNHRHHFIAVPNIVEKVKQVVAGYAHSVILTTTGTLLACGSNSRGQLGLGDTDDRHTFTAVELIDEVIQEVVAGFWHTLAMTQDGRLLACGRNHFGQLGLGDKKNRHDFTAVIGLSNTVEHITAGAYRSVIVLQDGQIMTCGSNYFGQLGLGDNHSRQLFTPVTFHPCGSNSDWTLLLQQRYRRFILSCTNTLLSPHLDQKQRNHSLQQLINHHYVYHNTHGFMVELIRAIANLIESRTVDPHNLNKLIYTYGLTWIFSNPDQEGLRYHSAMARCFLHVLKKPAQKETPLDKKTRRLYHTLFHHPQNSVITGAVKAKLKLFLDGDKSSESSTSINGG